MSDLDELYNCSFHSAPLTNTNLPHSLKEFQEEKVEEEAEELQDQEERSGRTSRRRRKERSANEICKNPNSWTLKPLGIP